MWDFLSKSRISNNLKTALGNNFFFKLYFYSMLDLKLEDFFDIESFSHKELWQKNGSIWSPLLFLKDYLKNYRYEIHSPLPSHAHFENLDQISIGKGVVIEPGVYIQGPCIIGDYVVLRHTAYLRGNLILGNHATVGHGVEIKHSILLDHATAAHLSYIGDTILGNRVNLGSGVKCANLRLDRKEVVPGLLKFSACVGDRTQIGCNVVLNPGTFVGKDSIIYPLQNPRGYIPPKSVVRNVS